MNILHICADPKPTEESASKQLAVAFFTKLAQLNPDINITNVDLYENPPPFLSYNAIRGFWYPIFIEGHQPTDSELEAGAYGREQGALFNEADAIVLTLPMWNFAVPAILKAWMDQVLSPGVTFDLTKRGSHPLHKVQKVVLLVSSGEKFKEDDERDCLTPQIRASFEKAGVKEFPIAWADGQYAFLYSDSEIRKRLAIEAAQDLAEEVVEDVSERAG